MVSSSTAVRTIIAHAVARPPGIVSTICAPRSPASRRAYGSRNKASGRSVSIARYIATQRAVSEMCSMIAIRVAPHTWSGLGLSSDWWRGSSYGGSRERVPYVMRAPVAASIVAAEAALR